MMSCSIWLRDPDGRAVSTVTDSVVSLTLEEAHPVKALGRIFSESLHGVQEQMATAVPSALASAFVSVSLSALTFVSYG